MFNLIEKDPKGEESKIKSQWDKNPWHKNNTVMIVYNHIILCLILVFLSKCLFKKDSKNEGEKYQCIIK